MTISMTSYKYENYISYVSKKKAVVTNTKNKTTLCECKKPECAHVSKELNNGSKNIDLGDVSKTDIMNLFIDACLESKNTKIINDVFSKIYELSNSNIFKNTDFDNHYGTIKKLKTMMTNSDIKTNNDDEIYNYALSYIRYRCENLMHIDEFRSNYERNNYKCETTNEMIEFDKIFAIILFEKNINCDSDSDLNFNSHFTHNSYLLYLFCEIEDILNYKSCDSNMFNNSRCILKNEGFENTDVYKLWYNNKKFV
jgi:hypothetical protein